MLTFPRGGRGWGGSFLEEGLSVTAAAFHQTIGSVTVACMTTTAVTLGLVAFGVGVAVAHY